MSEIGLYKSFEVGFFGADHARVECELVTPRVTISSKQVDKMNRRDFPVTTLHDSFSRASIGEGIFNAEQKNDKATAGFLRDAQEKLEAFIAKNGNTNPYSELDWAA